MNFTREPLVETIITPKEGHKLVIRNSKVAEHEEYYVDAIEIVTIGTACFFRCLEKPKPFFVPAQDYEILEMRETRMILKSPTVEKGIKIGGGREGAFRSPVREPREPTEETEPETLPVEAPILGEQRVEKKRDKRKHRKRRERVELGAEADVEREEVPVMPSLPEEEVGKAPRVTLIPPPSTLISETLFRKPPLVPDAEGYEEVPEEKETPLISDFSLHEGDDFL